MQKMSGSDLASVCRELSALQGKRIARIRKTPSGVFLFKIGTEELLFEPGVRLHLTRQSLAAQESPDGFVAFLRKNLEGKTAERIEQHGTDRILEITTRSKERLVFELFRKGNLIFIGEDGTVIACLASEEAGGRRVARGGKYEYPKATPYEMKLPQKIAYSAKLNQAGEPIGYSADASAMQESGREFSAFSEALDFYYANQREETVSQRASEEKVKKLSERLSSQKAALLRLEEEKEALKKKGDAIYSDFERLESLLSMVREMKKARKSEAEIAHRLSALGAKIHGSELEIEA